MAKVKVTPDTVGAAKTAIARAKVALPANAAEIMAERVAALKHKIAAPVGKAIRCEGKEFKFPGEDAAVTTFRGVIVRFASYSAFYENPWVEGANAPPNCFAVGENEHDLLEASPNSPAPEHPEGEPACKGCWASKFKSADNGKGKRCSNTIRLAVLCQDGEMRLLTLSSTAITPFNQYVNDVVGAFHTDPSGVMTEFSFDPSMKYGSVRCGNPIKLSDDQQAVSFSLYEDAGQMILREPDVSEFETKVIALRAKPVKGKPAARPRA